MAWVHLMSLVSKNDDTTILKYILMTIMKLSAVAGSYKTLMVAAKFIGLKYIIAASIIIVTGILVAGVRYASPLAITQQIITLAQELKEYQ